MTQVIKDVVEWLKQWFYTETEIDTLLASHSHDWELISQSTSFPTKYSFYVNPKVNLAELIIQHKDPDSYSGSTNIGLNVGSDYKPLGISIRMSNKENVRVGIATTGDVYVYGSVNADTNVQASIMWHYQSTNIVTPPDNFSITLSSDKDILSYYDSDNCILSATVLNNGNPSSNQTVEFFKDNVSIGTATTDSSGVATKTYDSTGVGDISFIAKVNEVTSTPVTIEDCIFFDATETTKGTASSAVSSNVYNNLSIPTLPNHFVWEMDMKVSSTSGSEDRMFLTPTAMSGDQPSNALWIEFASSSTGMRVGSRRSSNTYNTGSGKSYSANTYYHFKVERNGDTITGYIDDSNRGTLTESWINNYSSWWFSYTLWKRPNINCTWKNIKIKPL